MYHLQHYLCYYSAIILAVLLMNSSNLNAKTESVSFNFYAVPISIQYDTQMQQVSLDTISEAAFKQFYADMSRSNHTLIIYELFGKKKALDLNDWLYYLLIRVTADAVFADKDETFKTLFCWFMLSKSGYKVQLNYLENDLVLSVFTHDEVFDMPRRIEKDGWFVDISTFFRTDYRSITIANRFVSPIVSENTKEFQFYLERLPRFTEPTLENRSYHFIHDNEAEEITALVNKNAVRIMYRYPETSIAQQSRIPLSPETYASLVPQLKERVRTMTNYDAVRYLLSFTRQAFVYKTDMEAYGIENLAFSPEETLYYASSDCEDRSILFIYLVKKVLNLDAVLLDFPDHASAAVSFGDQSYGKAPIEYKGKLYTICEPTGPGNHLLPGDYPSNMTTDDYHIIEK